MLGIDKIKESLAFWVSDTARRFNEVERDRQLFDKRLKTIEDAILSADVIRCGNCKYAQVEGHQCVCGMLGEAVFALNLIYGYPRYDRLHRCHRLKEREARLRENKAEIKTELAKHFKANAPK